MQFFTLIKTINSKLNTNQTETLSIYIIIIIITIKIDQPNHQEKTDPSNQ